MEENQQKLIDKKLLKISSLNAEIYVLEQEIRNIKERNAKDLALLCYFCANPVNDNINHLRNGRIAHGRCLIANYDKAKKEDVI